MGFDGLCLWDHTMEPQQRLFLLGTGNFWGACVRVEILGRGCPIPNQKKDFKGLLCKWVTHHLEQGRPTWGGPGGGEVPRPPKKVKFFLPVLCTEFFFIFWRIFCSQSGIFSLFGGRGNFLMGAGPKNRHLDCATVQMGSGPHSPPPHQSRV